MTRMSDLKPNPDTDVPVDASPEPVVAPTRPARPAPRPRGGGTLALALLLALAAAGASGYIGWRQWQMTQSDVTDTRTLADLQQRLDLLQSTLAAASGERASLEQRLNDAAQVNRGLRGELLGQSERTRNLEDAVAKLAEKSLSGHDTVLLDEAESLLRMAGERYTLFHDAQGAAAAYAVADQTLAAVNDGSLSGLRQSISAEREALLKSQPATRAGLLQRLTDLRGELGSLPLKPLDTPLEATTPGAWQRVSRALSSVITVRRESDAPLTAADARFARELAALDLAQAQAAWLAYDSKACVAALERVDAVLASQFDTDQPEVQRMRGAIGQMVASVPSSAPVQLGAALNELRSMRAVHALKSTGPSAEPSEPASASTVAPSTVVLP